jgi:hypothetical protein
MRLSTGGSGRRDLRQLSDGGYLFAINFFFGVELE